MEVTERRAFTSVYQIPTAVNLSAGLEIFLGLTDLPLLFATRVFNKNGTRARVLDSCTRYNIQN